MAGINGSQVRKMGPEEANGPKGARRERRSKPMGSMQKSENGPQQARNDASKESKELMESP